MHIAEINFEEFYRPAFDERKGVTEFVSCVGKISAQANQAKIVLHQAARMIWLADRMEECAKGRPALQILFLIIAALLVEEC